MKSRMIWSRFPVLLLTLIAASVALGQSGPMVQIDNKSGEKREICFNKVEGIRTGPALRCFTMNAGESVTWNRAGDHSRLNASVYIPQFLGAKLLYTRTIPGTTTVVIVGEGNRFGFFEDEIKADITKYVLKVCNRQYDQTIHFTLGFEGNKVFATQGWWELAKGKCLDFPVSQMLNDEWGIPYGTLPRTYFFARIFSGRPLEWYGGVGDYDLCIDKGKAFKKHQYSLGPDGKYQRVACTGQTEEFVKFRRLEDPKTNQRYYYLTF